MNKIILFEIFKYLDSGYLLLLKEVNKEYHKTINTYFINYDTLPCKLKFVGYCNVDMALHMIKYYPSNKNIKSIVKIIVKKYNNIENILFIINSIKKYNLKNIEILAINNNISNESIDNICEMLNVNFEYIYYRSIHKELNLSRILHLNINYNINNYYNYGGTHNNIESIEYLIKKNKSYRFIINKFKFDTRQALILLENKFGFVRFTYYNDIWDNILEKDDVDLCKWMLDHNYYNHDYIVEYIFNYCSINILKYLLEINYISIDELKHFIERKLTGVRMV